MEPANPTAFGVTERLGTGLMPLDDVFRVHAANDAFGNSIGLDDSDTGGPGGAAFTA